jgi:hypothetical protein
MNRPAVKPRPVVALWIFLAACAPVSTSHAAENPKPDNPRAMFRVLGVEDRYFNQLTDGRSLDPNEIESVLRIIYRLRTFPPVDQQRWALDADKLAEAVGQPAKSRGLIFRLRGRVTDVEPFEPPKDAAERYELTKCFRCRLQLDSPGQTADIYTENVPEQWRKGAKPDAAAGALGVFLKITANDHGQTTLAFAAARLAWYPDDLLGQLGMDAGLLDSVQDRRPITSRDREAFYQMLAAVGRAEPGQLLSQAEENLSDAPSASQRVDQQGRERYSVVPLFNQPATQRGRLVALTGTARRVEKIFLGPADADITARFGIDHYYQVALFTDDSQRNPLTFCVLELPEGMPYGNVPHYGETVTIAGFFFKSWSYPVPKTIDPSQSPGDPKTHHQYSPLLIGRSLRWHPPTEPPQDTMTGSVLVGLFVLLVAVLWIVAWRSRRHQQQWLEQLETPTTNLDVGIDLDQVDQRTDRTPDFSHIAEMDHGPDKGGTP